MTYPNCQRRNVITETEAGKRVILRDLWMTFDEHDWRRWWRQSTDYPHDAFGLLPEAVERFLEKRQQELF